MKSCGIGRCDRGGNDEPRSVKLTNTEQTTIFVDSSCLDRNLSGASPVTIGAVLLHVGNPVPLTSLRVAMVPPGPTATALESLAIKIEGPTGARNLHVTNPSWPVVAIPTLQFDVFQHAHRAAPAERADSIRALGRTEACGRCIFRVAAQRPRMATRLGRMVIVALQTRVRHKTHANHPIGRGRALVQARAGCVIERVCNLEFSLR